MSAVRNAVKTVAKAQREAARTQKVDPLLKHLPVGFQEEADAMGVSSLKAKIIEAEEALKQNKIEMESDEELARAKAQVSSLREPYSDVEKSQRAVISYCLRCLEQQGSPVERAVAASSTGSSDDN